MTKYRAFIHRRDADRTRDPGVVEAARSTLVIGIA